MTSSGEPSCERMFFARTLPSSTPIWSTRESIITSKAHRDDQPTEGVDAPDDALREDLVLVERDERTKRRRREERENDAVARAVSLEDLGLDERVGRARAELLAHLVLGLAERERLGLREEVGEQDAVVLRAGDGVLSRRGRDEVSGDELGALVHELVERVLAVRPRRAPDDRLQAGGVSVVPAVRNAHVRPSGGRRGRRPW